MSEKKRVLAVPLAAAFILLFVFISTAAGKGVSAGGTADLPSGERYRSAVSAPVPGGPGFISISPMDFRPDRHDAIYEYVNYRLRNPGTTYNYFSAGLTLPDQAIIKKFVLYFYDNTSQRQINAWLLRCSLTSSTCESLAYAGSPGSADDYRSMEDATIDNPLVDNQDHYYFISVHFDGSPVDPENLVLNGARIDYEYGSTFFPVIMK